MIKRQNGGGKRDLHQPREPNGIGVEKTWFLHSQRATTQRLVRKGKVREAEPSGERQSWRAAAKAKELVK